jgi:hypothetical protein
MVSRLTEADGAVLARLVAALGRLSQHDQVPHHNLFDVHAAATLSHHLCMGAAAAVYPQPAEVGRAVCVSMRLLWLSEAFITEIDGARDVAFVETV